MYLFHFTQRFLTGQHAITTLTPTNDSEGALWRDPHGFKKLAVLATSTGKVFGIETQRGDIVWNFKLANPAVALRPLKLSVIKTVTERFHPEVALVGVISTSQGVYTAVLHIDAITGAAQPVVTLFEGRAKDAFEVDVGMKVLAVIDQDNKVRHFNVALSPLNDQLVGARVPCHGRHRRSLLQRTLSDALYASSRLAARTIPRRLLSAPNVLRWTLRGQDVGLVPHLAVHLETR